MEVINQPLRKPDRSRMIALLLTGVAATLFASTAAAFDPPPPPPPPPTPVTAVVSADPPKCDPFPTFAPYATWVGCMLMPKGTPTFTPFDTGLGIIVPFDAGNDGTVDEVFYLSRGWDLWDSFVLQGEEINIPEPINGKIISPKR